MTGSIGPDLPRPGPSLTRHILQAGVLVIVGAATVGLVALFARPDSGEREVRSLRDSC